VSSSLLFVFFQAEDGIRDRNVTGVQTCALPIFRRDSSRKTHCTKRGYFFEHKLHKTVFRLQHTEQKRSAAYQQHGKQRNGARLREHFKWDTATKCADMTFGKQAPYMLHQNKKCTCLDTTARRARRGANKHQYEQGE